MIIPVTYGIPPHIPTIYIYIYMMKYGLYIWINPHFWMGLYGLWDELRVIYIYDKSRIRFVGCPAPRTVESLETRRENFALALAGQLSVFFCRTSERTGAERSEWDGVFFANLHGDFTCNWYYIYIYIYTHASVFLHVYVHISIYIYIYIRMCVCYNTHIHI